MQSIRPCHHMPTRGSFAIFVMLVTLAPGVWASEPDIPFTVRVGGNARCGSDLFSEKLVNLSARLTPATRDSALDLRLEITREARVFRGSMQLREKGGIETTRAVVGGNCDEVLSALALIAAVLIDPDGSDALRPAASVPGARASTPRADASANSPTWRFGIGVGGGVETSVGPEVVATASVQGEMTWLRQGLLSPRLALAVHRSAGDTLESRNGNAHFRWTAARVSACPVRFPVADRLALRPCLFFDLGELDAAGQRTYRAESTSVAWYGLGSSLHAEYVPAARLSLGLDAGLMLPLLRARFYFDPGGPSDTLELPRLGLTLRIGVATYFE